jgi:hypothetical protein
MHAAGPDDVWVAYAAPTQPLSYVRLTATDTQIHPVSEEGAWAVEIDVDTAGRIHFLDFESNALVVMTDDVVEVDELLPSFTDGDMTLDQDGVAHFVLARPGGLTHAWYDDEGVDFELIPGPESGARQPAVTVGGGVLRAAWIEDDAVFYGARQIEDCGD